MTFPKGAKGDKEFGNYCRDRFPGISKTTRLEYMAYRKRLKGPANATAFGRKLPPLKHYGSGNSPRNEYQRIVNEQVEDVKAFERQPEINESELIQELAEKIVDTGYKVLAVKLHPDKDGGSNEAMRNLNKAKKLLKDALIRVAAQLI
jgi:hypothetical protein